MVVKKNLKIIVSRQELFQNFTQILNSFVRIAHTKCENDLDK